MTWRESRHIAPRPDCLYPDLWTAPDRIATEDDVADLWVALIRALKPQCVVELGAYWGYTTEKLGRAVKEQGFGKVYAIELDGSRAEAVRKRVLEADLPVIVYQEYSLRFTPPHPVDLLICDTEPENRVDEVVYYRQFMSAVGVVIVHDTAFQEAKFVEMRQKLENLPFVRWVFLPTPRGCAIGRYVHERL